MEPLLQVVADRDGERAVLAASGEIDVSSTDVLQHAIRNAADGGGNELVLDLHDVRFIDSTGIRCLLEAESLCQERSIALRVIPSPAVRRLAELTGVSDRLSLG